MPIVITLTLKNLLEIALENADFSLSLATALVVLAATLVLLYSVTLDKLFDVLLLRYEPYNIVTELLIAWTGYQFYTDVYLHKMDSFLQSNQMMGLNRVLYPFFYMVDRLMKSYKSPSSIETFERVVRRNPNGIALVFTKTGQKWTFAQLDSDVCKLANHLVREGVKPYTTVSLFLENEPLFIISWLACLKVGAIAAFINPKLTGDSLIHVLKVSESAKVVCKLDSSEDQVLLEAVNTLAESSKWQVINIINSDEKRFSRKEQRILDRIESRYSKTSFKHVDLDDPNSSSAPPSSEFRSGLSYTDIAMLIYTSGTTGLPKPAVITHARFLMAQVGFAGFTRLSSSDVLYSCLPLYHGSAAMGAFGSCMVTGSTFLLSPKFSARGFFKECKQHNASVVQYIGELGRFLLSTDASSSDKDHKIRLAFGNGMRKDIWLEFKNRFNIPVLCEFYGSTEGTATLVNYQFNDKYGVGSCGRIGLFQSIFAPLAVIKIDIITQEVSRVGKSNYCQACRTNEEGELIGYVKKGDPITDFKGYKSNAKQTNSKILSQVFTSTDTWFRSGDVVVRDSSSYLYFVDRLGDTFRWKGENVATTEVANALAKVGGVDQVNVYGVLVPNNDGRAGMAAIQLSKMNLRDFDLDLLASSLSKSLPKYAVPLFLRFVEQLPVTATMKHQKFVLVQQGIDPEKVENIFIFQREKYIPFTTQMLNDLISGKLRC